MADDELPNAQRIEESTRASADHSFYQYYAHASNQIETLNRFRSIQLVVERMLTSAGITKEVLDVADIGCGAGTQSLMWAEKGHTVNGLDINRQLVALAKQRAIEKNLTVRFSVGTATNLPWPDQSMDVCLVPELLEHVPEWRHCLDEFNRILRPGGILFLSTNNKLCPKQSEFDLPLYSWYPHVVKRRVEHLAMTSRPKLAGYAKYPAVNWFTFFELRQVLKEMGMLASDRFDLSDEQRLGDSGRLMLRAIRNNKVLRWLAHVATPYTMVVAVKHH